MHAHAHWVRPHGNKCGRIHTVRLQVLREGSRNQAPRMESIEEIDPWNSRGPSVSLKEGVELNQLHNGVILEIDTEAMQAQEPYPDDAEESFEGANVLEQLNTECIGFAGNNLSDSDNELSPFEKMAKWMTVVPGSDGNLLKKVLRSGHGDVVPEGATVRVHYNGYLEYSDEPYDSSRLRNRPLQFKLGQSAVIEGWDCGVATMQRSEIARFLVNPSYAFGDFGCPPRIPPGATIMFEIELISFIDYKAADEFGSLTRKEKKEASLEQLLAVANAEREAGNELFKQNNFGKASSKYLKAVRLLESARLKDEIEEKQWKEVLLKLYLNQSLVSLKLNKHRLAVAQCKRALDIDPRNVKANFRLGQAFMKLSEFKKSRDHLLKAGRLSPGNQEIRLELQKLDRAVSKFRTLEKTMYTKMVQFSAPTVSDQTLESSGNSEDMNEMREQLVKELTLMRDKVSMKQMVLPQILTPEQVDCARQVARELGLKTEKAHNGGLRIYKEEDEIKVAF
ncbi:inactive peptidyl-prolyl cis-trans isomerase FKBP6-like [Halichondria panicea]|uniref:inactive peptidyl-prolyl cis-trans isomerase FKBP6-like n=1 Tax=Halichondria panicea TaxID=6063 RepID=UPI00312B82B7